VIKYQLKPYGMDFEKVTSHSAVTVSVVIPCFNEVNHIRLCLASVVANDFPKEQLELLVVDGQSEDGTRDIILEFTTRHPWIKLLENVRRITPEGKRPRPNANGCSLCVSHQLHFRAGSVAY
jgi:cellulose synthase/poly-beta-1,6-N-acetylglucosamine synthase-like glycosyltransferase